MSPVDNRRQSAGSFHDRSVIKGPADASHFRVQVGRYGDRWYTDPLEADDRWAKCDDTYPSISTVKKASGQDWSAVSIGRIAKAHPKRLHQIADLDEGERYDALTSINKRGLAQAADRGNNAHLYAEALLRGTTLPLVADNDPARAYFGAIDEFFDTYQPKLVAAEYVVIHRTLNGVGYGGTPDAIVDIGGELYGIDWKTRTETSNHGAYPEEGAQIAAGARADYMIVEGPNGPVRQAIPELAGGLIISIKPDGCKVYPIDLDQAWAHWCALHAWWVARRSERDAIGKPWAPRKRPTETVAADADVREASASGDPGATSAATPTLDIPTPDEGATVDPATVDALKRRYLALPDTVRKGVLRTLADEATVGRNGRDRVPYSVSELPSVRRFEITRGLVILCEHDSCNDDVLRAIVHTIAGDTAWFATLTTGQVVGMLSADEAALFAERCDQFVALPIPARISDDGRMVLEFGEAA